ncbi:MAG: histidinol dehydrogenase [Rhodobacteraceae bacterium]|nr:histidinol dehydrogenase [Paracoccaceae bacterium]
MHYLKSASAVQVEAAFPTDAVRAMLDSIREGGEERVRQLARELDKWQGDIVVTPEALDRARACVSQRLKDDIAYAHDNIRRFAEAQRESCREFEVELRPGLIAGQRLIPVESAGCYVPGGRYSHIASAIMTVTTAKAAGVGFVAACSPPREGGIPAEILYTLDHCGADRILALGGVQGIAALAFGLFGTRPADILVGPGNQYVAEAKRLLFGTVGIDMVAGPTDSMILADGSADPETVAMDLVGQAEHGYNSPVWLATDDEALAREVIALVPDCIATLPEPNRESARRAWEGLAEVVLCTGREEMAQFADRKAPEHLHVQAADPDWWLGRLRAYGSLFLGAETTVAFGDKAAGPNHVLPTSGAARYTGGLSALKFLKMVTWQKVSPAALRDLAQATARISRREGMEGHARTADIRLRRHFPGEDFDLGG